MKVQNCILLLSLALGSVGYAPAVWGQDCIDMAAPGCTRPNTGKIYEPSCAPGCRRPCQPPCQPPCPPCAPPYEGPPREGYPQVEQPREAVPGIPRGAYAAPPQSGMIEGPRTGVELGGMSITLPEMTLGLPKIRIHHRMRLFQQGQMRLAEATAPYVENPYYAYQTSMLQAAGAQAASQSRGAEQMNDEVPREVEQQAPRGAEELPTPRNAEERSCLTSRDAALDQRLDRLERCLELQCKALNQCIQHMNQTHGAPYQAPPRQAPPQPKVQMKPLPPSAPQTGREAIPGPPQPPDDELGHLRPSSRSTPIREIDQASYKQLLPTPPPDLQRLPPIRSSVSLRPAIR